MWDLIANTKSYSLDLYLIKVIMGIVYAELGTKQGMFRNFGIKWGTECLNTRFSLPTLLRGKV